MIRLLIADDQALVRGGFRMILDAQQDIEVVGEASDGREALERARGHPPRGRHGSSRSCRSASSRSCG